MQLLPASQCHELVGSLRLDNFNILRPYISLETRWRMYSIVHFWHLLFVVCNNPNMSNWLCMEKNERAYIIYGSHKILTDTWSWYLDRSELYVSYWVGICSPDSTGPIRNV